MESSPASIIMFNCLLKDQGFKWLPVTLHVLVLQLKVTFGFLSITLHYITVDLNNRLFFFSPFCCSKCAFELYR
jgi:hypothetical protein